MSWSGYLFAPVDGEYYFSGWVDGDVYISVNGVRITRKQTTGAGYSGSVYLTGETWVPIFMYFETNGGSNNMMLKWRIQGTGVSDYVPRKYLNDEGSESSSSPAMASVTSNVTVIRRY